MKIWMVIGIVLMLPQLASARVYICVDAARGKTSVTDKACATNNVREEVRVDATNLDSGAKYGSAKPQKVWRSEEDTRKTGADYAAERNGLYDNKATASSR